MWRVISPSIINWAFKILGGLVLLGSGYVGWYWMGINKFADAPIRLPTQASIFNIEAGASLHHVARQLHRDGIISQAKYFVWMARWDGLDRSIKAGEYLIKTEMTPRQLLNHFVSGKVNLYKFTIVEGWTFRQLLEALWQHPQIKPTLQPINPTVIMAYLDKPELHPEGQFLPDTYHFPSNTSDLVFLQRAHDALNQYLEQAWQNREVELPYQTPYEALIMASIIEKETGLVTERQSIAGVFVRRLRKKMRLQTDPTVIYGLGETYTGNLRRRDLKKDTPYNTYTRQGLTPTPIALPSADAIEAALHPAKGNVLYFVAKGDGSHYFSATIQEHNRAVRQYQLRRNKQTYRSTPKKIPTDIDAVEVDTRTETGLNQIK